MEVISGKELSHEIKETIKAHNLQNGLSPCLAIIVVGDDKETLLYIGLKQKAVTEIGGTTKILSLPADISREALLEKIAELNQDDSVHGILLQLPVSDELAVYQEEFLEAISPNKDVDGCNPRSR